MKFLLWLLILGGLVLGPAYYLEARYISGDITQTELLYGRPPNSGDGGAVLASWHSPVTLKLDPTMNPIALDFGMQVDLPTDPEDDSRNVYATELKQGDKSVWSMEYSFGTRPVNPTRASSRVAGARVDDHEPRLRIFDVGEAADYTFSMKPSQQDMTVRHLDVQVRRNVSPVNFAVVATGVAMLGLGLFLTYQKIAAGPPQYPGR